MLRRPRASPLRSRRTGRSIWKSRPLLIPPPTLSCRGFIAQMAPIARSARQRVFVVLRSFHRPDVMAVYTTRIEADKTEAPVLLSNGNLIESGSLAGGRHFAVWHDPHPKPS